VKTMRRTATAIVMAVLAAACGPMTGEEAEGEELSLGGFGYGPSADVNPRAMEIEAQEKIAACMKAQGWEYTPYVNPAVLGGLELSDYDEEKYRKTHGFGIATEVLRFKESVKSRDPLDDPNAEITQAMSEEERAAYEAALYGDRVEEPSEDELEVMTDEERVELAERRKGADDGCFGEAWRQVLPDDSFREEFGGALDDAYERAATDPRLVEAEADWSACMAKRGHGFGTPAAMYKYLYGADPASGEISEFQKRVNDASGRFDDDDAAMDEAPPGSDAQAQPGGDAQAPPSTAPGGGAQAPPSTAPGGGAQAPPSTAPGGGAQAPPSTAPGGDAGTPGDDAQAPPGGDVQAPPGGDAQVPPGAAPGGEGDDGAEDGVAEVDLGIDMEKLQPLIDEEISMAVSDWECGEELRPLRKELYDEVERNFIDENRDRLLEFQKRNQ